jgi:alpha-mannosidase
VSARVPIVYTFGNHMHWVDMEWLWGYHVLPGSVRDMLHFCQQTGARGNVNFDGVGYEKLAAEDPEALADLRHAVRKGIVEVVGASYGQPYGGLHGGESNVRQRVYGVRSVLRTLGVRPRAFWEEEFDFFPQLPQLLAGCGFENASLFFQWTWHTPEIPMEDVPAVAWEAPDGSRLRCATRNRLNLHQWPEDVQVLMDELASRDGGEGDERGDGGERNPLSPPSPHHPLTSITPMILQWLELMPSPDWMCRSEILLPKTKELLGDPRFEVTFATLSGYLDSLPKDLPVRRYTPDEVFHGMTLGKNGDLFRRFSRLGEHTLLNAETLAAVAGRFGRPYAQWDVYPAWELEEAWRELLQAQHHDNDECEGLCGHVGRFSYERSLSLAQHVQGRTADLLARRVDAPTGSLVAFNPLGWIASGTVPHPETGEPLVVRDVPAMGWKAFDPVTCVREPDVWHLTTEGAVGRRRGLEVRVDARGSIAQIVSPQWPEGALSEAVPLLDFACTEEGERVRFELESFEIDEETGDLVVRFRHPIQGGIRADLRLATDTSALDVTLSAGSLRRMDGGMNAGLRTRFGLAGGISRIVTDSPYAFHEVEGKGHFRKKYPTGDWMTSPQWFEEIRAPFHSLSTVDLLDAHGQGLLVIHDGSPQWFRRGDAVENVLTCYDPWDEEYWIDRFHVAYRLVPHAGLSHAERHRAAQSFLRPPVVAVKKHAPGDLPTECGTIRVSGAVATAFYRETADRGDGFDAYAARSFEDAYPYVLRLAEFDGEAKEVTVELGGTVAHVARTDFMGERTDRPVVLESRDGQTRLRLSLRAYEVTTLYLDIEEGRKRTRDLDAHRNIWATVHRVEE